MSQTKISAGEKSVAESTIVSAPIVFAIASSLSENTRTARSRAGEIVNHRLR
jgi:hypothetical protein